MGELSHTSAYIANDCKVLLFFFTFDVNRFTIKCCSSNDFLIKNSYTKNCFWRRGIADVQSGPLGTDCGKLSRRCHGAGSRRTSSGTPSWSSDSSGPGQTFNFSTIKREIQLKKDILILSLCKRINHADRILSACFGFYPRVDSISLFRILSA